MTQGHVDSGPSRFETSKSYGGTADFDISNCLIVVYSNFSFHAKIFCPAVHVIEISREFFETRCVHTTCFRGFIGDTDAFAQFAIVTP